MFNCNCMNLSNLIGLLLYFNELDCNCIFEVPLDICCDLVLYNKTKLN